MEYKLYKGYILGPGEQHPAIGVYETNIYRELSAAKDYSPFHTSESEWEAQLWIDGETTEPGYANQADVDELNRQEQVEVMSDVFKEGTMLLVVDRNGVQLFSLLLGGMSVRCQAWEEVYKTIMEGLPDEAYKPTKQ